MMLGLVATKSINTPVKFPEPIPYFDIDNRMLAIGKKGADGFPPLRFCVLHLRTPSHLLLACSAILRFASHNIRSLLGCSPAAFAFLKPCQPLRLQIRRTSSARLGQC